MATLALFSRKGKRRVELHRLFLIPPVEDWLQFSLDDMPLESLLPAAFEYGCGFLWGRLGVHLVWVWTVGLKAQVRAGGHGARCHCDK
jgi:hypothetical protein